MTASEWGGFVDFIETELRSGAPPKLILTVTHRAAPPSASDRKRLAELLRSGLADPVVAHAFVTDSRVLVGVLTALDWVVKKPYKESVFGNALEAVRWLATFASTFDVAETVATITRLVPSQALPPELLPSRRSAAR